MNASDIHRPVSVVFCWQRIEEWATTIVDEVASYIEISPSGKGLHILGRASLAGKGRKADHIEIYDTGRYFTFTGNRLRESPTEIQERQNEIESLYSRVRPITIKESAKKTTLSLLSDEELLERAMNAKNGERFEQLWHGNASEHQTQSEADFALVKILCFWTPDDAQVARLWRASELYREKLERDDYVAQTITNARRDQTESYNHARKPSSCHYVVTSENRADDPPISEDPNREGYLRRLLANSSRMTRARMMMVSALGFEKVPWRLLNAIHAHQRNRLGVKIIGDRMLEKLYVSSGERSASERTIRRDKERLWKAQEYAGVELIKYTPGKQNLATGENFASRYTVNLDRWALMAIDRAITMNNNNNSIRDEQLKAACEEVASNIKRRRPKAPVTRSKKKDSIKRKLVAEVSRPQNVLRPVQQSAIHKLAIVDDRRTIDVLLTELATQLRKLEPAEREQVRKKIDAMLMSTEMQHESLTA